MNTPGGLEVPKINGPTPAENWRHGDLKPANILGFEDQGESLLGTLKLADLGRARQHANATKERSATLERCSTREYDPPEVWAGLEKERSRFVDIWSFGCVLLESLI
jgi:serine/threonine protein kinase